MFLQKQFFESEHYNEQNYYFQTSNSSLCPLPLKTPDKVWGTPHFYPKIINVYRWRVRLS